MTKRQRSLVGAFAIITVLAAVISNSETYVHTAPRKFVCTAPPQSNLPFDLISTSRDLNQFRLQPKWGGQTAPTVFPNALDTALCPKKDFSGPQCSSRPHDVDAAPWWKQEICVIGGAPPERAKGHVNWEPATYEGTISFGDYSDDFDWTWNFKPLNQEGLTQQNPPSTGPEDIHAEFNATETVDGFLTATWAQLRDGFGCSEDESDCAAKNLAARRLVGGKRAILTGLLGLDTEHGGYSELHPVYAMAIEVNPDVNNDTWILFIRNRGNEGFCSQHDHPLPAMEKFRLLTPKPMNSQPTGATFSNQTSFSTTQQNNCPVPSFDSANGGVVVEYAFLDTPVQKPFDGPILEGEIHIQWQLQGPSVIFQPQPFALKSLVEDERFLTNQQRKQFRQSMKSQDLQLFGSLPGFHMCSATFHAATPLAAHPPTRKITRKQIQNEMNAYSQRMTRELCRANNSLAGCQVKKKRSGK